MSAGEIAWRLRSASRSSADYYRFRWHLYPSAEEVHAQNLGNAAFRVTDLPVGFWSSDQKVPELENTWRERLLKQANEIREHKLSFFDLQQKFLGNPIDWNRDHSSGKAAPLRFSNSIDYRDFNVTGDCKLVWEPNRHHHLVVLARAFRATGDSGYADTVVEQLESWLEQCPFGTGMNWRSPLELGVRLINWVWTFDLIRESGRISGDFERRLLHAAFLQIWQIRRYYSRASSANNHTIGEAAGVFIACSYFDKFPNAKVWRDEAKAILEREILAQTYPDGCTREQAIGYQMFVLYLFMLSALVGRKSAQEFSPAYWERIDKMLDFLCGLSAAGDPPLFGDCDDAYVLDLGGRNGDYRSLLAMAAILFQRPRFKAVAGELSEPVYWLLGSSGRHSYEEIPAKPFPLRSEAFSDSGYYLLQSGSSSNADSLSVTFDCGELGFKSIAAHGHADALSITLRAFGRDILVDPGTFDYFTYPEWRNYFRSTRAHNTVEVDGTDQSEMLGSFLWGTRARAQCLGFSVTADGSSVIGEHDGYTRLQDPVTHRREVHLDAQERVITITDDVKAKAQHQIALWFHFAEDVQILPTGNHNFDIQTPGGVIKLEMDSSLELRVLDAESEMASWVSRGYHQKRRAMTLVGKTTIAGAAKFQTTFRVPSGTHEP